MPVAPVRAPLTKSASGRRGKRAPLEFVGRMSATLDDVRIIQDQISALKMTLVDLKLFRSLKLKKNKNMKIAIEGLRRNRPLINETFREINVLYDSFEEVLDNVVCWFHLITKVINMMHRINAREINSISLVLSELDELIDSYSTLLKG